ncbi:hypothetical protein TWF106_006428 [Orbilia oligospora]|uniref:Uncharacterized protein n=1 Tax=Orbilia oligospora TaxID=2813651 RepID=A0A7C8V0S5_ORBOL|nr:hypothetical protein TWF106_006428 [Orbilia oligospora]
MKSCGHGLTEGYKCGGGPHEDCRKAWKKHQYEGFAEHIINQHSSEDPKNPQFEYDATADGYYCGFCVKRIPTTTHRSLIEHLRGLHFKPEELTNIRLWVSSYDVDLSQREEAIQRAHEAFIREIDLNPQPFDLAQIELTSGVEEGMRALRDTMMARVDRRELLSFRAYSEDIGIELDYGSEG